VLPVEDLIEPLLGETGTVALLGGFGSGRTTALRHLRSTLPSWGLRCFDEPGEVPVAEAAAVRLVVYTGRQALSLRARLELRLEPWGMEDLAEYLLARHRERCRSVLARVRALQGDDPFAGSPELWAAALDEMAADETLGDVWEALDRRVRRALGDADTTARAGAASLAVVIHGPRSVLVHDLPDRLLAHEQVGMWLAAWFLAGELREGRAWPLGEVRCPRELLDRTAGLVEGDVGVAERLRESLRAMSPRCVARAAQPAVASLLRLVDPAWRPESASILELRGAWLSGVDWSGARLGRASLDGADLSGADLSDAVLDQASAVETSLRGAKLPRASLRSFRGERCDLCGADLTDCVLRDAHLRRARLDGARLVRADLAVADLIGVTLEGADLTEAVLNLARASGLCFAHAVLEGTRFRGAWLQRADFEGARGERLDFRGAALTGARFMGAVLPDADFQKALLYDAKLADVSLRRADFRGADLRGATFHMGTTRSGLVDSPIACEGSRTGFYTDELLEQAYRAPEEIRKADLRGADLRGAQIEGVDFYLVDLRDAIYDPEQEEQLRVTGAILTRRPG